MKSKTHSAKGRKKSTGKYNSDHRKELAKLTVQKIEDALFDLFQTFGNEESLTYKLVAQKAGVTEITVYRNFPQRSDLMKALWKRINKSLGEEIRMPQTAEELLNLNGALHKGFSKNEAISVASLCSTQGREMRVSLNAERQPAFLKIVKETNPALSKQEIRRYAAILQMFHSAYAWDSFRLQWQMSGDEIAATTQEAIEFFLQHIRKPRKP